MRFVFTTALFISLCFSCGSDNDSSSTRTQETPQERNPLEEIILRTPSGDEINTSLAYRPEDQQRGLSGVKPDEFGFNDGKFFFYFAEGTRTFWMPNMLFSLDIFYLDKELRIQQIVRDLPYPEDENDPIPRAPAIRSRHVLEMKADSPISNELKIGDQFEWESSLSMEETERLMKENL